MVKVYLRTMALGALALGLASPALAQRTATGTFNGVTWQAQSRLIGATSTGGANGGGDAAFFANQPKYNGVVSIITEYADGGRFICSGSMISQHHVLTAGHCVSSGAGTANPVKTTAYFGTGDPNNRYHSDGTAIAVDVSKYYVHSGYTGEVIDQNDIAILALSSAAPGTATIYDIASVSDLTGAGFNIAGFGGRSDVGGAVGVNQRTGYLRQGDNRYDWRLGDSDFDGFWTDRDANGETFFGTADIDYSYLSDFDNGLSANDTSCRIAVLGLGLPANGKFCNTGVGAMEVGVAGGDSGGPQFVNGKLSSVTSYGLTFGATFGDVDGALNSSWGEFSGYVPLYIHGDFIAGALAGPIPEPETWAMMLLGFGFVGAGMRARTRKVSFA